VSLTSNYFGSCVRAYRDVLWKKRKEMIKEWSNIDPVIAAGTVLGDDRVVHSVCAC
jgi:hypothetical protein